MNELRISSKFYKTILKPSRPVPHEDKKLSYIFYFTLLFGASKGVVKAFIKPFEAPQRSVKIKIVLFNSIQLSEMHGMGKVKELVSAWGCEVGSRTAAASKMEPFVTIVHG